MQMYDDTMMVDKAYYNELKDKADNCEFWYQEYYSLYLRLASLKDKLDLAINSDDIMMAKEIYEDISMLLEFHYEPPKE